MGPIAGLDAVAMRKISAPAGSRILYTQSLSHSLYGIVIMIKRWVKWEDVYRA